MLPSQALALHRDAIRNLVQLGTADDWHGPLTPQTASGSLAITLISN
jgi:hypothetical protein